MSSVDYPVIDGFVLNTQLKCNLRFLPLALVHYEALRRSGAMRSKAWLSPKSASFTIPARDAFEEQLRCVPGAAIWGWTLTGDAGLYSLRVVNSCDNVALQSEVLLSTGSAPKQNPLSRLLIVSPPGLLNIEICNLTSENATIQLILWGGEPVCV